MKSKSLQAAQYFFKYEGSIIPIHIRRHKTSRRMIIRYQPVACVIAVTIPRYVSVRQGLSFVEERRTWVEKRIAEQPTHTAFAEGNTLPVLGQEFVLQHIGGRGVVRIEENWLLVPGNPEFMARRVREWLKQQVLVEIQKCVDEKAPLLGKKPRKISLRDTSSRWGSCSSNGHLSFSWRLVFAPRQVLHYLVCHELAHLAHMNHSTKFWKQVEMLYPDYKNAERWLKYHGNSLYHYG